jgi:2-polyprenyl-3-methyl-5-hydroxy-6-metoxy-1,4-benzoquinol methylase
VTDAPERAVPPGADWFRPFSDALRAEVTDFYTRHGTQLHGAAWTNTLETNSGFVERRASPLVDLYRTRSGRESIEGLRVLDLGCGFGALSVYLAAKGARVTGVDPNTQRFEVGSAVASAFGLPVRFEQGRMQSLPLPQGAGYDLAIQNNSLCYVLSREERHAALARTLEQLKPGGWLLARNPNRLHPFDQFTNLPLVHLLPPGAAVRAARAFGRERSRVRLLSPRMARHEARRAGFTDVRTDGSHGPRLLTAVARYQHVSARRPD